MAVRGRRVTVTDEPTPLNTRPTDAGKPGSALLIKNPSGSGVTVDVGDDTVATGEGYELAPGDAPLRWELDGREFVHAVAPSGQSVELQLAEQGV